MAYQPEAVQWDDGVYQLEATDPVDGGVGAVSNKPLLNLANRTAYLKQHIDALESGSTVIDIYAPKKSPALTGTPTAPTQAAGDNSTKIATDQFVQTAVNGVVSVDIAGNASTVLTAAQYGASILLLTGAVTADKAVIFPTNITGRWVVFNNTTGNYTITLKTASGNGVTINRGLSSQVFSTGVTLWHEKTDFISPVMSGNPTAPTPAVGDSSPTVATTAFVQAAMKAFGLSAVNAPFASDLDALNASGFYYVTSTGTTGIPFANNGFLLHFPWADGSAMLQIYVAASASKIMFRTKSSSAWRDWQDLAMLDSPYFTGNARAPSPALGTNNLTIATTGFVQATLAALGLGNYTDFRGTVFADPAATPADIIAAGIGFRSGFVNGGSNGLNVIPTGTTVYGSLSYNVQYKDTTALASCVRTFQTQNRVFTSYATSATTWSGWWESANLASPAFTGVPTAPTPNKFTNSNQLATTAFVKQNAGNFYSFNSISANFIFQPADCGSYWVTNVGSGDVVATLPTANSVPAGATLTITHSSGSMNSFSIIPQSGDSLLIDGLADNLGKYALTPNETLQLVSNGGIAWKFVYSNGPAFLSKGIGVLKGIARFTASTTFTVPAGVYTMWVSGCGGGGGGGGGSGYDTYSGGGGGGGSGYIAVRVPVAVQPGQVWRVTIGGGGAAGASGASGAKGSNGTAGGITSLTLSTASSPTINLGGGGYGAGGGAAAQTGAGGAAGAPGGSCGTDGRNNNQGGDGGAGASGPYGIGGGSGRAGISQGAYATQAVGFGTGGGGGGACYGTPGSGGPGSAGMPGFMMIEW